MRYRSLIGYTIRETVGQKIFLMLLAVFTVLLVVFIFGISIDSNNGAITAVRIFHSKTMTADELPRLFPNLAEIYVAFLFVATIVLCIIGTGHIFPEAFSDGTIEMLAAKPVSRQGLIVGRFAGVIVAVVGIQMYFLAGIAAVLSMKTGVIRLELFNIILPMSLAFASTYAWMVLLGVAIKNTGFITSIGFLYVALLANFITVSGSGFQKMMPAEGLLPGVVRVVSFIFPQVADLRSVAIEILTGESWSILPVVSSVLSGTLAIGLAIASFRKMDL